MVVATSASQPQSSKRKAAAAGSDGEEALDEDTMAMRFREGKTGKVSVNALPRLV